ncbi:ankyrin [Marasmius fiardii PR-910]|nr:ankyrin [Marasmius fiardii PR-910]
MAILVAISPVLYCASRVINFKSTEINSVLFYSEISSEASLCGPPTLNIVYYAYSDRLPPLNLTLSMPTLSVHSAAQTHQIGLLRTLISEDSKLANAVDEDGRTPLHWAASSGSLEIVRILLEHRAEVDKIDGSGWTALHIAVRATRQ